MTYIGKIRVFGFLAHQIHKISKVTYLSVLTQYGTEYVGCTSQLKTALQKFSLCAYFFVFKNGISLHSPSCPGNHFVDKADL